MFLHLLPHYSWWCCFFSLLPIFLWTLPFLMPFLPTLEILPLFLYYFLLSHFSHLTLHHPACQYFKFVICFLRLSFYLFSLVSAILGPVAKLLTSPTHFLFSSLSSNSNLVLVSAHLVLSISLSNLLYTSKDMVYCF